MKLNSEKVSYCSVFVNVFLAAGKAAAGIIGHSHAMIADAVHSLSDVISTFIVLIALKVSKKSADREHPYGHDRFESLLSLILVGMLAATGIGIGINAINSLKQGEASIARPGVISIIAAVISIVVKELMYQVTIKVGKAEKSEAVIADAWHHRSDALSSIGSLIGIIMCRMNIYWADIAAGMIICLLILKTAFEIGKTAVEKLTDHACDDRIECSIREDVLKMEGVKGIDLLKTRSFGSGYYVDLEIAAEATLTLKEAHAIAEHVHRNLEEKYPDIKHCMVHVNPYENEGKEKTAVKRK